LIGDEETIYLLQKVHYWFFYYKIKQIIKSLPKCRVCRLWELCEGLFNSHWCTKKVVTWIHQLSWVLMKSI